MADILEGIVDAPQVGPTQEQINAWKKEHGDICRIKISGRAYIYRGITRAEHKQIRSQIQPGTTQLDQEWLDEQICKIACLSPNMKNVMFDALCSGDAPTLSEQIMRLSGYDPDIAPEKL